MAKLFDDLLPKKGLFDDILADAPPILKEYYDGPHEITIHMHRTHCNCGAFFEAPRYERPLARYTVMRRVGFSHKPVGSELLPLSDPHQFPMVPRRVEWSSSRCDCCSECYAQAQSTLELFPRPLADPIELWRKSISCAVPLDPEQKHQIELKAQSKEDQQELSDYQKALIANLKPRENINGKEY